MDYLLSHGSDDKLVVAGMVRGGQQYFDWRAGATDTPMGLGLFLSGADLVETDEDG
jgi:hypothetical protein